MSQHYFTESPEAKDVRSERTVTIQGHEFAVTTAQGVFSHDRLDKGTAVFLDKVPAPELAPGSVAVDLGCGWGPITLALASAAPDASVWAIDVNERSRELTALNASRHGLTIRAASPEDALSEIGTIDLLWSNPPIRIGKNELHELLHTWIGRLSTTGVAYMVVQKNLGADSLATWMRAQGWTCEKIGSSKGFRILEVRK